MSRLLVNLAPKAAPACRLVCLPHAGGGLSAFADWSQQVSPDVEIHAAQLPGRDARIGEATYDDMERLRDDLYAALEPLVDVPTALFGHSMGALVAFELARETRRRAAPAPLCLFVSAYPAPRLALQEHTSLSSLPEAELLRAVTAWCPQIDQERGLLTELLPVLRADFAVCERYQYVPEAPLATPISAFGGISDTTVPRPALAAWEDHTTGPFRLRMLPGDHLFHRDAPTRLLRAVDKDLAAALSALA